LQNLLKFPRIETANLCFRNRGDLTFEEVGAAWGFNMRGISHGAALGDLDNDGDLDVVVNNLNQAASVYRNDSPAARVAVRLKGKANVQGIGGRVKVLGGPVTQSQSIVCGSRYLSGDDPMRVFAAGLDDESIIDRGQMAQWPAFGCFKRASEQHLRNSRERRAARHDRGKSGHEAAFPGCERAD
jgi:hypothetical protein